MDKREQCIDSIAELKEHVRQIVEKLGTSNISRELQQKFDNFNNQHNTYVKAVNTNKTINEILNLSKAVGLQASVLGSAIVADKLVNKELHPSAIELRDNANSFRNWVEEQSESGSAYKDIDEEKLVDKQHRMLRNTQKATVEEIIEDNYKLKGEIQELREKINEKKFDEIEGFYKNQKSLKDELEILKESEKKKIQLQKSYQFWEEQAKSYNTKFRHYAIGAIFSSLLLLIGLFVFLYFNPVEIKTPVNNLEANASLEQNGSASKINFTTVYNNQVWIYSILILFSSITIWFIRIIVKITLSNYHLATDANERVIMIRTYLSLLEEGKGFDKDDQKVMLDNIFRPTNFGIIKDETQVTLMDLLNSKK